MPQRGPAIGRCQGTAVRPHAQRAIKMMGRRRHGSCRIRLWNAEPYRVNPFPQTSSAQAVSVSPVSNALAAVVVLSFLFCVVVVVVVV